MACTNVRLRAQERIQARQGSTPGPAAYDATKTGFTQPRSPVAVIGTALRSPASPSAGGPGPSDYQDALRTSTVRGAHVEDSRLPGVSAFSIGTGPRGALGARSPAGSPGPGAHSPQRIDLARAPATRIGTGKRGSLGGGGGGPGPGAYAAEAFPHAVKPASPRQPMGTSPRFAGGGGADAPGPGAYATHLVDSLTGRMISSTRSQSARQPMGTSKRPPLSGSPAGSPGANAYSPSRAFVEAGAPAFSMARAPRAGLPAHASETPGPASYAVEALDGVGGVPLSSTRPHSARVLIGNAKRPDLSPSREGAPGPGAYDSTGGILACVVVGRPPAPPPPHHTLATHTSDP